MDDLSQRLRGWIRQAPTFDVVVDALARGERVGIDRAPAGARPALIAELAQGRPLLVIAPEQDGLRDLAEDVRASIDPGRSVWVHPPLDLDELADVADFGPRAGLAQRLRILRALARDAAPIVVSGVTSLLQAVPPPGHLGGRTRLLAPGEEVDLHELSVALAEVGYSRVPVVEAAGEFAIRGGIFDVFPLGEAEPIRVELFGDDVESLRTFDPQTQRSTGTLASHELPLWDLSGYVDACRDTPHSLVAHLPEDACVVVVGPERCREVWGQGVERFEGEDGVRVAGDDWLEGRAAVLVGVGEDEPWVEDTVSLPLEVAQLHAGKGLEGAANAIGRLVSRGDAVTVVCLHEAERERLHAAFTHSGLAPEDTAQVRLEEAGLSLVVGTLAGGVRHTPSGVWVLAAHRLLAQKRREEARPQTAGRGARSAPLESFADLSPGDPVVHVSHGVAIFEGVVQRERDGKPKEFLQLRFDGGMLSIPTERIGLIRRYVGPTARTPRLSKLGGAAWKRKTKRAQAAVRDLAAQLLEVQARRQTREGVAFPGDDRWQHLFEASCGFTDTPDQRRVTAEIKADMESTRPMDRLICGDVGYGKTELAIRAAFKCVNAGYQVAVLVPTTVLAHQHHHTFTERMAAYPVKVEVLSRFRTPAQQRVVVEAAKRGEVDVVVGTHRLLSRDVSFPKLGLVIVDEEQRFGVEAKEKVKALRETVDLLTLTATPIPRTLHMALSGARDISVLQTPPPGRSPVETHVIRQDPARLQRAIERELARDGQVFVVHDRVRTIGKLAQEIEGWVPTARVSIVHGQLPEATLEKRMLEFMGHGSDVLVATTLIENGIDVRRANTLIVDRAHMYGLAEMHQLRGRVGRGDVPAIAYFVVPKGGELSDIARRRLRALEEASDLGAGFHIAMRDLEIRGAGNVLGAEQSGHIADVGYDLYCRLLRQAMGELRGELTGAPAPIDVEAGEVEITFEVAAFLPDAYVADAALKIDMYRRLADVQDEAEVEALGHEWRDRFGALPGAVENLLRLRVARLRAAGWGVISIGRQDRVLQLRCVDRARLEQGIRAHHDAMRPIDTHMLFLVMDDPQADDDVQLSFLLEALAPAQEREAPDAPLDVEAATKLRERGERAKEYKRQRRGKRGGRRRSVRRRDG